MVFVVCFMYVDFFRKPPFKAASGSKSSVLEGICLIKLNLHLGKKSRQEFSS